MKYNIIVSPSGKFYGSEQVLFDYLSNGEKKYRIFLPDRGDLYKNLLKTHRRLWLNVFVSIRLLYLHLGILCLFRKLDCIYLNEGGHNRYGLMIAKLFPRVRVVIHLRILEDAHVGRWPKVIPHNIQLVTVSNFLQNFIPFQNVLIYDPYPFSNNFEPKNNRLKTDPFKIGIIGRICFSKGIEYIVQLLQNEWLLSNQPNWRFYFYGEAMAEINHSGITNFLLQHPKVELMGFESNKTKIYKELDCVLHAAKEEPLGRIFLEAIDHLLPFVGFDSGGIGEIAHQIGYTTNLCENVETGNSLLDKLINVSAVANQQNTELIEVKARAMTIFSIDQYSSKLDRIIKSTA